MADQPGGAADVSEVEVRLVPSREYELVAVATAVIDGPAGGVRVRRRYEALPRHNDVVDPEALDSNDELVGRSDAVHVHTRYFAADEAGAYLRDRHDTWTPGEVSVLEDPEAFLAACREHHAAAAPEDADRAAAELEQEDAG